MALIPDYVEIDDSALELLAWNVSNELISGFAVNNFEAMIGVSKHDFTLVAVALRGLPSGERAKFGLEQARIFRNALAVVLDELGVEEFDTRTGHSLEEGRTILRQLGAFVGMHQGGQA